MLYSVSPRLNLTMVGLKPSWNFSTRMPTRLAARKWPSSWTNTSTPSTKANDKSVVKPRTSHLQLYPARHFTRETARPFVNGTHLLQSADLGRIVSVERRFDNVRNRGKRDLPIEEPRHRDLVGRVQDDRPAALGLERAIGQTKAGKGVDVGRRKVEPPGVCEVERGQPGRPPIRIG